MLSNSTFEKMSTQKMVGWKLVSTSPSAYRDGRLLCCSRRGQGVGLWQRYLHLSVTIEVGPVLVVTFVARIHPSNKSYYLRTVYLGQYCGLLCYKSLLVNEFSTTICPVCLRHFSAISWGLYVKYTTPSIVPLASRSSIRLKIPQCWETGHSKTTCAQQGMCFAATVWRFGHFWKAETSQI